VSQQLGLFAADARNVIASDATGTIVYTPAVFTREESGRYFSALRDDIDWHADRRWMYDREVDTPRLIAYFEAAPFPPVLETIRRRVEPLTGVTIERIGLNFYRDERDSVAWHNDRIAEYGTAPTIALVSFGATRRMLLRTKPSAPRRRSLQIDLEPGSLLLMQGASQLYWEHSIPKERRPLGARISVALRKASD
jgi:alkylated DNA repair dioxygenase AlkB